MVTTYLRRVDAVERALGPSYADGRDASELSSVELALCLLDDLPQSHTELARAVHSYRDTATLLGDVWASEYPLESKSLRDSLECYIAGLFCDVLASGASPHFVDRLRRGYPERIFNAANAAQNLRAK